MNTVLKFIWCTKFVFIIKSKVQITFKDAYDIAGCYFEDNVLYKCSPASRVTEELSYWSDCQ